MTSEEKIPVPLSDLPEVPASDGVFVFASKTNPDGTFESGKLSVQKIKEEAQKKRGYFNTYESLIAKHPNPSEGETATAGTPFPGTVYDVVDGAWHNTGVVPSADSIPINDYMLNGGSTRTGAQLDNDIKYNELFSILDVIGCGAYTELGTYTQGGLYNKNGIFSTNSYWEYTEIPIVSGSIYNFHDLRIGDGTVAPLILKKGGDLVKIFNNNIKGKNVQFSSDITSILVSRAIGVGSSVGIYDRYVENNVFATNKNSASIFKDADTPAFYINALLDLKINGITGNEVLKLGAFFNRTSDTSNQISIRNENDDDLCSYWNGIVESGIKEVYLSEHLGSGYSGYATINFDVLLNATSPSPLNPRINNEVVKYDSIGRSILKRIDYFPYAKDVFINGIIPTGIIEDLSLRAINGASIPSGNITFSNFKKTNTYSQVTINSGSTVLCNFYVEPSLSGIQTIKLDQYSNSGIEGYIRVNFDLMSVGVAYSNSYYYLDKKRIFNDNLFKSSLLSLGLIGKKDKTLLSIGDSLTAAMEWQKQIKSMLGMTVRTHAKGGAGIIQMIDGYDALPALSASDVTDVDYIALYGGYNNRDVEYGNIGDVYPTNNTIIGMIQYAINRIYELLTDADNLQCKIIIITPHCAGKYNWCDADGYGEWPIGSGKTLEGIAMAICDVANYNSIPCIDLWHNSGINKFTWNKFQSSNVPENTTYTLIGQFNLVSDLPVGSLNQVAKVLENGAMYNTMVHNGTTWKLYNVYPGSPFPYNADQLHLNPLGYAKIGEHIARFINNI